MPPLGLDLRFGLGSQRGGGISLLPETKAYIAAMPNNTFTADDIKAINVFIQTLIAEQIWDEIDQYYLLCGKTSVRAETLVNMKYPTATAATDPTQDPKHSMAQRIGAGALTYDSGVGWITNNGAAKLTSYFLPTAATSADGTHKFGALDGHIHVFCQNDIAYSTTAFAVSENTTFRYSLLPKRSATEVRFRFGSTTNISKALESGFNSKGVYLMGANTETPNNKHLRKAVLVAGAPSVSTIVSVSNAIGEYPTDPITVFYYYNSVDAFYAGYIGGYSIGGGLTASQSVAYCTALATLYKALGALT